MPAQERTRSQIRRILLLVDTIAPYRFWSEIEAIRREVCDRLGETYSLKTIYRDLVLLQSLGLADRRDECPTQWKLVLRSSESAQEAAIRIYADAAPPEKHLRTWRLSEGQAQKILDSGENISRLARRYNVSRTTVYNVKRRVTWKHLVPSSKAAEEKPRRQAKHRVAGNGDRWTSKAMTINESGAA